MIAVDHANAALREAVDDCRENGDPVSATELANMAKDIANDIHGHNATAGTPLALEIERLAPAYHQRLADDWK
jgi:hypothetical protein